MKTTSIPKDILTKLNEKHGWFEFGDAQSDVSNAFAADVIKWHQAVSAKAFDMFCLLKDLEDTVMSMDGTSVENERLVDRYIGLINNIGDPIK